MQAAVFPSEPFDESPADDIPELPIPRPGEQRVPIRAKLKPPRLGTSGGASYTANDRIPRTIAEQQALDAERFTWELASRLTSGMLANPARANASVKDAMSIFDDFLQEMHDYVRIATESTVDPEAPASPSRGDYFHAEGPGAATPAPSTAATPIEPAKLPEKPRPAQPRPNDAYWNSHPPLDSDEVA